MPLHITWCNVPGKSSLACRGMSYFLEALLISQLIHQRPPATATPLLLLPNGDLIIIDELLTPDSSRFWSIKDYAPGRGQDSYDKQVVRDYLLTLDWDKTYPGPSLPDEIIKKASTRYREILKIITGQ